jgi:hypothetical protein
MIRTIGKPRASIGLLALSLGIYAGLAMPKLVHASWQVFEESQAALVGEMRNFVLHD